MLSSMAPRSKPRIPFASALGLNSCGIADLAEARTWLVAKERPLLPVLMIANAYAATQLSQCYTTLKRDSFIERLQEHDFFF